jgi:hypothetical protein
MDCSVCDKPIVGNTWIFKGFKEELEEEFPAIHDGTIYLCNSCYCKLLERCSLEELQEIMDLLVQKQ